MGGFFKDNLKGEGDKNDKVDKAMQLVAICAIVLLPSSVVWC